MATTEEMVARVVALEAVVQMVEAKTDAQAAGGRATNAEITKMKSAVDEAIARIERRLVETEAKAVGAANLRVSSTDRSQTDTFPIRS